MTSEDEIPEHLADLVVPVHETRGYRVQAIMENAEWLARHDLNENSAEAAKRLGLIKGDADALLGDL